MLNLETVQQLQIAGPFTSAGLRSCNVIHGSTFPDVLHQNLQQGLSCSVQMFPCTFEPSVSNGHFNAPASSRLPAIS